MLKKSVLIFILLISTVSAYDFESSDLYVDTINLGYYGVIMQDEMLWVGVSVTNMAPRDMKDLRVTMYIDEVNEVFNSGRFDVGDGDTKTIWLYMDAPYSIPKGDHLVRFYISNDDVSRVKYRYLTVI